ncbi:MAG: substrate-binding domain-containing protein, partial [Thermoleophilia bacterium]|nr:substrate-binding domain-containing protein [Thermoleophilia bacterium]
MDKPVIPPERGDDLHNLEMAGQADVTLFMAGNQFMVMEELLAAFRREHPEIKRIFYETLPPGLELKQILAGGMVFRDRVIELIPDVYSAVSKNAMEQLAAAGLIDSEGGPGYRKYLHNRLALMVPRGNPAGISSVADLGREDV